MKIRPRPSWLGLAFLALMTAAPPVVHAILPPYHEWDETIASLDLNRDGIIDFVLTRHAGSMADTSWQWVNYATWTLAGQGANQILAPAVPLQTGSLVTAASGTGWSRSVAVYGESAVDLTSSGLLANRTEIALGLRFAGESGLHTGWLRFHKEPLPPLQTPVIGSTGWQPQVGSSITVDSQPELPPPPGPFTERLIPISLRPGGAVDLRLRITPVGDATTGLTGLIARLETVTASLMVLVRPVTPADPLALQPTPLDSGVSLRATPPPGSAWAEATQGLLLLGLQRAPDGTEFAASGTLAQRRDAYVGIRSLAGGFGYLHFHATPMLGDKAFINDTKIVTGEPPLQQGEGTSYSVDLDGDGRVDFVQRRYSYLTNGFSVAGATILPVGDNALLLASHLDDLLHAHHYSQTSDGWYPADNVEASMLVLDPPAPLAWRSMPIDLGGVSGLSDWFAPRLAARIATANGLVLMLVDHTLNASDLATAVPPVSVMVPIPRLEATMAFGRIMMTWDPWLSGAGCQFADNLNTPNWSVNPASGNAVHLPLNPPNKLRGFYRLRN